MQIEVQKLFKLKSLKMPYKAGLCLENCIWFDVFVGKREDGSHWLKFPEEKYVDRDGQEVAKRYFFFNKEFSKIVIRAIEEYMQNNQNNSYESFNGSSSSSKEGEFPF